MHCKFPIFINDTIALHVSGRFSAHHQERYQPYNGFGTILCSSVTDCCQEQDVGVVVKALRYKPAGRGFDSRWCH